MSGNSRGIANVTLRGNGVNGAYLPVTERDGSLCLRENAGDRRPTDGRKVRLLRSRGSACHLGEHDGLGSEQGLATPSPDGKGENLNPVTVDHAAGFLRHARTQL